MSFGDRAAGGTRSPPPHSASGRTAGVAARGPAGLGTDAAKKFDHGQGAEICGHAGADVERRISSTKSKPAISCRSAMAFKLSRSSG